MYRFDVYQTTRCRQSKYAKFKEIMIRKYERLKTELIAATPWLR